MKDEGKIENRLIDSDIIQKDESSDLSLRPQKLSEFIGQPQVQKIYLLLFLLLVIEKRQWTIVCYLVLRALEKQL